MKLINTVVFMFLSVFMQYSLAGIKTELNQLFSQLNETNQFSRPGLYESQKAGFYSGGSFLLRSGVQQRQLLSIQMPYYRAGCGGIDLFGGAFSFIKGKQLENLMRNIINNSETFAFELAMETLSPMIAEQMKHLQSVINTVNQQNINSCETAASLVGGLWPKMDTAQQHVCTMIGSSKNLFSDWASARLACGSRGKRSEILQKGKRDPVFKPMIFENTNIVWESLKQSNLYKSDVELAEFILSLSGTIILEKTQHKNNTSLKLHPLFSLATDSQLIKSLLYGGKTKIYQCDERKHCLHPVLKEIEIKQNMALQYKIMNLLRSISNKIQNDHSLDTKEIAFLNTTNLPIYKILTVYTAYTQDVPLFDINYLADIIGYDIIDKYLNENLHRILDIAEYHGVTSVVLTQFKNSTQRALQQIYNQKQSVYQRLSNSSRIISMSRWLEKQLASQLANKLLVDH